MGFLGKKEDPENPPQGPIPFQQQPKRIQVVIPDFEVHKSVFLRSQKSVNISVSVWRDVWSCSPAMFWV